MLCTYYILDFSVLVSVTNVYSITDSIQKKTVLVMDFLGNSAIDEVSLQLPIVSVHFNYNVYIVSVHNS